MGNVIGSITITKDEGRVKVGNNPHDNPNLNDLWLDTSGEKQLLKYWDGENWTITNDYSSDILAVDNKLTTNYLTEEKSAKQVETIIGTTTITTHNGQEVNMKTALSDVIQTAEKINWLVTDGSTSSSVNLTKDVIDFISTNINLKGNTTFSSLISTDENNVTKIDGGSIASGTILADSINIDDLFSDKITTKYFSCDDIRAKNFRLYNPDRKDFDIDNYGCTYYTYSAIEGKKHLQKTISNGYKISLDVDPYPAIDLNTTLDFYNCIESFDPKVHYILYDYGFNISAMSDGFNYLLNIFVDPYHLDKIYDVSYIMSNIKVTLNKTLNVNTILPNTTTGSKVGDASTPFYEIYSKKINIFGNGTGCTNLYTANNNTTNNSITFPNKTGTIALTSDLFTITSSAVYTQDYTSVASSTSVKIQSFVLSAGKYIIDACFYYAANATGVRKLYLGTREEFTAERLCSITTMASNNGATMMHMSKVLVISSNTTINLIAWQNSGKALNVNAGYRTTKIG